MAGLSRAGASARDRGVQAQPLSSLAIRRIVMRNAGDHGGWLNAGPALPVPGLAKVAVMLAVYLSFLGLLHHGGVFDPGLDPLSKFAVACGIISFWVLASPLMSLAKGNVGPVIFAALTAVFSGAGAAAAEEGTGGPERRDFGFLSLLLAPSHLITSLSKLVSELPCGRSQRWAGEMENPAK